MSPAFVRSKDEYAKDKGTDRYARDDQHDGPNEVVHRHFPSY